tara:strand:- start:37 stop:210 length:174 start_codon:yes stop_codon:yes gene_type:complete
MNKTIQNQTQSVSKKKEPGFLGRIVQKLDDSMKKKAEEKTEQGTCCGGSDDKGGKCC